jgi:L-fuculose-phosphate aldolase
VFDQPATAGTVKALTTKCLVPVSEIASASLERRLRCQICNVGRSLYEYGFAVACEGNISVRLDSNRILVTPTGTCKGRLSPEDLVVTDMDGAVICGDGSPSSEIQMHLLYYRSRPEVHAICHAHPPTATGFAAAGRALEDPVLPEVIVNLGTIPLAPYGTPGTRELCAGLEPLVMTHDAILLENHGLVTCGQDLDTAYQRLEIVEQFARVVLTAQLLGGPRLLSRVQLNKLNADKGNRGTAINVRTVNRGDKTGIDVML